MLTEGLAGPTTLKKRKNGGTAAVYFKKIYKFIIISLIIIG